VSAPLGRMFVGAAALTIGTAVVVVFAGSLLGFGVPRLAGPQPAALFSPPKPVATGTSNDFIAAVLGDTEDRWSEIFAAVGRTYHPPRLVLFSGALQGGCGVALSATGPFYCPADRQIYLDKSFFDDLQSKLGGCSNTEACELPEAYIIAHEVGHHVQDELGILPRVLQAKQSSIALEANQLQVRLELQADCLAGIWANRGQKKHPFMAPKDLDQALQTAAALGDDRLQREAQGYVVLDSFTHGTSEQRKRWFLNGFNSGQISACDTYAASSL
jgi:uncharacterized protein